MKNVISVGAGLLLVVMISSGGLAQEQSSYVGSLTGVISVSPSFLSLSALSLKSCHVGMAEGIRGAAINPAALTDVKNFEIALAMAGGRRWRSNSQLSFDAGEMVG
ncbi:hypothetical protein E3J38_05850, partial [candidate division TA06 bacterium]